MQTHEKGEIMKMNFVAAGLALATLLAGPAQGATTFRFVSLSTQVVVNGGSNTPIGNDDVTTFNFNELPVRSTISRTDQGPDSVASASADISTDFASPDQGAFIYESIFADYSGSPGTVGGATALGVARYAFTVDVSTIATVDYSLFFDGNVTNPTIRISQNNVDVFRINPTSSGQVVSTAFGPGNYELFVNISAGASSSSVDSTASRSGRIAFAFVDAGVPEPATWAMMIGGIGAAGGAVRRRKANVSVTYA